MRGGSLMAWPPQVKSPNDRLMDRQSAWLKILANGKVNVSVCQIGLPPPPVALFVSEVPCRC